AEVDEFTLVIERDGVVRDALDDLDLVVLAERVEAADGLGLGDLLAADGQVLLHDRAHGLLDARQVLGCEAARALEVVVEAVLDHRADGDLGLGEEALHGLRHQVRRGVSEDLEARWRLGGDRRQAAVGRERPREVDDGRRRALDARRDRPRDRLAVAAAVAGVRRQRLPRVSREQPFAAFFFAVFLFLLYQLYLFVAAFFAPLVWAAILALAFYPLTNRLVALFRGRRGLAALVLVLAVTVGVVLPSFLLGSLLVREATGAYRRLQEAVQQGELVGLVEQVRGSRLGGLWVRLGPLFDQLSIDLSDLLLRATNWVSDQIVGEATALARNALRSVVNFAL